MRDLTGMLEQGHKLNYPEVLSRRISVLRQVLWRNERVLA